MSTSNFVTEAIKIVVKSRQKSISESMFWESMYELLIWISKFIYSFSIKTSHLQQSFSKF